MASESKTINKCTATAWLEEDNLMLLECWTRDGYTFEDIANRIGISYNTLRWWRKQYPEIDRALKAGREIVDYKVENALLKSALGYKTREVKVTTTIRGGKVIETVKETLDKEQAPNVHAAQCWLYNRLPKKWKNMNSKANILDDMDEDTSIQVIVTRATKGNSNETQVDESINNTDKEWQDEINQSIKIRKSTEEEKAEAKRAKTEAKSETGSNVTTKVENEAEDDLDYWPEDWEEEDWED